MFCHLMVSLPFLYCCPGWCHLSSAGSAVAPPLPLYYQLSQLQCLRHCWSAPLTENKQSILNKALKFGHLSFKAFLYFTGSSFSVSHKTSPVVPSTSCLWYLFVNSYSSIIHPQNTDETSRDRGQGQKLLIATVCTTSLEFHLFWNQKVSKW